MSISLSSKLKTLMSEGPESGIVLRHWCPACNENHLIYVGTCDSHQHVWYWNKDVNKPTFAPSLRQGEICHYTIIDGIINFFEDCKHAMAGQQVPLPDYPFQMRY